MLVLGGNTSTGGGGALSLGARRFLKKLVCRPLRHRRRTPTLHTLSPSTGDFNAADPGRNARGCDAALHIPHRPPARPPACSLAIPPDRPLGRYTLTDFSTCLLLLLLHSVPVSFPPFLSLPISRTQINIFSQIPARYSILLPHKRNLQKKQQDGALNSPQNQLQRSQKSTPIIGQHKYLCEKRGPSHTHTNPYTCSEAERPRGLKQRKR